jgi:hypothetical protein
MIASELTYFPPIWLITSEYSFSAPIAVMVLLDTAEAEAVEPAEVEPEADVPLDEDADEQAASRAAATGRATTARAPVRVRMTLNSRGGKRAVGTARGLADEHRYGNHFH